MAAKRRKLTPEERRRIQQDSTFQSANPKGYTLDEFGALRKTKSKYGYVKKPSGELVEQTPEVILAARRNIEKFRTEGRGALSFEREQEEAKKATEQQTAIQTAQAEGLAQIPTEQELSTLKANDPNIKDTARKALAAAAPAIATGAIASSVIPGLGTGVGAATTGLGTITATFLQDFWSQQGKDIEASRDILTDGRKIVKNKIKGINDVNNPHREQEIKEAYKMLREIDLADRKLQLESQTFYNTFKDAGDDLNEFQRYRDYERDALFRNLDLAVNAPNPLLAVETNEDLLEYQESLEE